METDIRGYIINNFIDDDKEEIENAIVGSIEAKDEVALPGLGVFFELLWENSNDNERKKILEKLEKSIKKQEKDWTEPPKSWTVYKQFLIWGL